MDKNIFGKLDEKYEDTYQKVRDIVNGEGFKTQTCMMGIKLVNATKNGKGKVSMEYDAPRCFVDISGNEWVLIMAMQRLIEHFGVEQTLGLIVANCFVSPKTENILKKTFETYEEKEVFKTVMNMSEEEREKIKNEL